MTYTDLIFLVAAKALLALIIMLLLTVFTRQFKLWPTPHQGSWQSYTFWPLFRGGLGLTLLYAAVTLRWPVEGDYLRFAVGLAIAALALAFTIYGYFDLGIENTYGSDEGLVTNGLYRYSRNPQYVASIIGFVGVALAHGGWQAVTLCALAILVYSVMPFTEEPWLQKAYGDAYSAYKARTPRFLII